MPASLSSAAARPLPPPVVRLEGISKSFGPVRANRDITLDIRPTRIKALLGENGAGKSTLMSILAGRSRQDAGVICVDGLPARFRSPKDALAAGIGMVYQHFMLVEAMTVAENLMLGQQRGRLNPVAMQEEVRGLAERYGLAVDPAARIADLSMGERQRVEILKLLYRDCRVLILDEPTAVLTPPEIVQLSRALRCMADEGKAVVFISHKMREVLDLADEVAVLRGGEIVDEFTRGEVPDERELAARMIGHEMERVAPPAPFSGESECLLRVERASCGRMRDVGLVLRRGWRATASANWWKCSSDCGGPKAVGWKFWAGTGSVFSANPSGARAAWPIFPRIAGAWLLVPPWTSPTIFCSPTAFSLRAGLF